jgi:excisionase family DNA binding protein
MNPQNTPRADRLLTVEQVAALLNVSKMTIYRLCHGDELAYVRIGRSMRISERGLNRYLAQGGSDPASVWSESGLRHPGELRPA